MNFDIIAEITQKLNLDFKYGTKLLYGKDLAGRHSLMHLPDENAIYDFTQGIADSVLLINLVNLIYKPEYQIFLAETSDNNFTIKYSSVEKLPDQLKVFKNGFIIFQADPGNRSFLSFVELIAHLRSPEGCPWDRKQTHLSLRTNLLEETYEVLEAIDADDQDSLSEELGDVLLQIVLHAQLANESGKFNIYKVIKGIHDKLVFRHPHVFSDWDVKDASSVIKNWEVLKSQEREQKDQTSRKSLLDSVPKHLPALSLAQKYQERAARVGFDWPEIAPVIEKIKEEIKEITEAQDSASLEWELGDLLFALVNLIRWYGMDAESVLRQMNQRFLQRFKFIEEKVALQGRQMTDLTLEEMDVIWEQAKEAEAKAAQNAR